MPEPNLSMPKNLHEDNRLVTDSLRNLLLMFSNCIYVTENGYVVSVRTS